METCFFRKLRHFISLLAVFLFFISHLSGQEQKVVRDLGLWTELKLNKEVLKDLELALGQHLRFNKNITSFDDYIFELELEYKINKQFAIGTSGRYSRNKHYDETEENDYRYDLFFKFDTNISESVKIYYRLKYQKEFYDSSVFNEFLNYYETTFRNRLQIGWEGYKNSRQYASAEIFRMIKKSRDPYYSKYRIFAGNIISVYGSEMDVAVGYEHRLNNNDPYNLFIVKMQVQFEL